MSSYGNGAYSAPRGYDLRAPYNVPLGEIKCLRVVRPFSVSSYQQNTIVEGFNNHQEQGLNLPPGIPWLNPSRQIYKGMQDPETGEFSLRFFEGHEPSHAEQTLMKCYLKNFARIR